LAAVRGEISALHGKLARVKAAPLPQADQKELVEQYVIGLMRQAAPNVAVVGDRLRVGFRGDVYAPEDVAALVSWLAPELVCRALERELAAQPERAGALPKLERLRQEAELEAQVYELERKEEALILRGADDGIELMRRPNADPRAVLGVRIATAVAQ